MTSYHTRSEREERREKTVWYVFVAVGIAALLYFARDLECQVLWRYRQFLLKALLTTVLLTLLSISFGMIVAIVLAAGRLYGPRWLRYTATAIIEIVRAVPQLLILLWVFFVIPEVTGKTFTPEVTAIVALTVIAAAYLAEVIRGGLMSVDRLQFESGYATGLSKFSTFMEIDDGAAKVISPAPRSFAAG